MDSLITAAARALARGDALGALNSIALRDDPPALALRGIAMAQIGDLARARLLLRRAEVAFGPQEAVARARCITAEAEIALVSRDLSWPLKPLRAARLALDHHGDCANAAYARGIEARYLLLVGRPDEAEQVLANIETASLPLASRTAHALIVAGIAMRRLRMKAARTAIAEARCLAEQAKIPLLAAEVEGAARVLDAPAARLFERGAQRSVQLDDVEKILASERLVVDACRHFVCHSGGVISLATRPVLFKLVRVLAEVWPGGCSRETLIARTFRARHADGSHRARLRVEIGRLRKALGGIAAVTATKDGFVLVPRTRGVAVLAPLTDEAHAAVLALLGDGETWSSSALALALGTSARTVQRALDELATGCKVQAIGKGRARRWMAPPVPGFPTALLLPAALPGS